LILPDAQGGAFVSFRIAIHSGDELVERSRLRWLITYPDTPTRAAFGELAHRSAT
jgi:hypothetical protein